MLEYADDRPWPGSTSWSDAVSRTALDTVVAAVQHLTGYEVSCIRVVHRGVLRAVAVQGPPDQRALLMDSHTPVEAMEAELALGDDWGRFRFVPAGRFQGRRDWGAVVATQAGDDDDPQAWAPEDVLAAPIRDDAGAMIALVSVDAPADRRRADPETRARLEGYAELAEVAVRIAVERAEQLERIQMARAVRQVVAAASQELSMEAILAGSAQALMSGFSARGLWLHTFDAEGGYSAVHAESGVVSAIPTQFIGLAERVARRAWDRQTVGVLSGWWTDPGLSDPELDADQETISAYLTSIGIGSVLFVPLGAAGECLGSLALSRGTDRPRWTAVEVEAGRDIGMDLGRAILNARAFEREQQAVRELQALDSYKSQLVATLSHELKTPLASVLGNLELLTAELAATGDGQRAITAIDRGTHRLVRVVDDLMLLAKVGDPGHQLLTRPVDVAEVVRDVVELTATTAAQAGLVVEVGGERGPVVAPGDADELDRVVSNLLSNAIKYTPAGGRVEVGVTHEGDDVVLTCADTGIGIGEADQRRLFHEFFRSSDPAAQGRPGTGLGLAIVDQVVRRHGGRVEVRSSLGCGSTFRVVLPTAGGRAGCRPVPVLAATAAVPAPRGPEAAS